MSHKLPACCGGGGHLPKVCLTHAPHEAARLPVSKPLMNMVTEMRLCLTLTPPWTNVGTWICLHCTCEAAGLADTTGPDCMRPHR